MTKSNFIYDSSEDYSLQKNNFLTPVYFEKEALIPFIYSPYYGCEFVSETYGALTFDEDSIPFGINSKGHLIFWLGDLERILPDKLKNILKSYNIKSDRDIESDFKKGQLDAIFTDNILEVELFLLLNKLNTSSKKKFGFNLFNLDLIQVDDLLKMCSAYKRITFNNEEDFKIIINDLNEKLIETINKKEIISYFNSKDIIFDSKFGRIKLLEIFFKEILFDKSNLIAPFFYLYDIRIWAVHSRGEEKFKDVIKKLGIKENSNFGEIYKCLIKKIYDNLKKLLIKMKNY